MGKEVLLSSDKKICDDINGYEITEVEKIKYVDLFNEDILNFTCESFNINKCGYKFENITMNNFILNDLAVSNEDIALIKIK